MVSIAPKPTSTKTTWSPTAIQRLLQTPSAASNTRCLRSNTGPHVLIDRIPGRNTATGHGTATPPTTMPQPRWQPAAAATKPSNCDLGRTERRRLWTARSRSPMASQTLSRVARHSQTSSLRGTQCEGLSDIFHDHGSKASLVHNITIIVEHSPRKVRAMKTRRPAPSSIAGICVSYSSCSSRSPFSCT